METKKQASILAIGNELLLGQIINKNAAQISEKALDYNLRVSYHLVVADDIDEIVSALKYLTEKTDIVFVCGGLGPTEDDLTREAIARFMRVSLNQDNAVLKDLKQKIQQRGVQFTLNHVKQAQFPTGSKVMKSDVGTADGFHVNHQNKDIFAVPGPWAEIESCWTNYMHDKLRGISLNKIQLERFQIIGFPESEVSARAQELLKGSPFSAEYRIHQPFIELRVDVNPANSNQWEPYAKKIEEEFKGFIVGKGNVDKAKEFIEKIKDKKVLFVDAASHGYLGERLLPLIKGLDFDFFQISSLPASYAVEDYDICFEIRPVNENEWLGLINNTIHIPIERLSQRKIREANLRKKFSEIFFWRVLNHL
ncbi:MAG: competence/damage-inducible protein A [Bdellovibrionales bacterium]|nr:competence/damage-inducible protein A [Bdellovibrionales bacterium]